MKKLVKVKLKSGKIMYKEKEVFLSSIQTTLMVGRGENSTAWVHEEHLKYEQ